MHESARRVRVMSAPVVGRSHDQLFEVHACSGVLGEVDGRDVDRLSLECGQQFPRRPFGVEDDLQRPPPLDHTLDVVDDPPSASIAGNDLAVQLWAGLPSPVLPDRLAAYEGNRCHRSVEVHVDRESRDALPVKARHAAPHHRVFVGETLPAFRVDDGLPDRLVEDAEVLSPELRVVRRRCPQLRELRDRDAPRLRRRVRAPPDFRVVEVRLGVGAVLAVGEVLVLRPPVLATATRHDPSKHLGRVQGRRRRVDDHRVRHCRERRHDRG